MNEAACVLCGVPPSERDAAGLSACGVVASRSAGGVSVDPSGWPTSLSAARCERVKCWPVGVLLLLEVDVVGVLVVVLVVLMVVMVVEEFWLAAGESWLLIVGAATSVVEEEAGVPGTAEWRELLLCCRVVRLWW